MSYHQRVESRDMASFLTTRTRNSELWFVNNEKLEDGILGYAAKYATRYGVKLYGLAIEGNHIQGPALFPNGNRADFMRDFNASVARAVPYYTPQYPGGRLWGRRYSAEFLPGAEDIEEYLFYTALQPIKDGLVERLKDYPGYNFFNDAVRGIERKFKVVNWTEFHAAKRYNPEVSIKNFIEVVTLKYERLPGYEHLSQKEYATLMYEKLEKRRQAIVAERHARGQGFVGKDALKRVRRGSLPQYSKTSTRFSHRPRVLSICDKRRAECKAWYFKIYFEYRDASKKFRAGDLTVKFPEGTYRPWTRYHPPPETGL